MKQQNVKEGEYEILEEHTNAKTASVRERELQEQHGYRVDNIPYYKTLKNVKKAFTPQAQKKRVANIDWKAKVANTDYKAARAKGVANTDYSKIDYKAIVAKIDYKAFQAQRVANTDWKAKVLNTDYKAFQKQRIAKWEKPVLQFDKQGNLIKQWKSAKKVEEKLNICASNIGCCCRGGLKSAGGYVWKYAN